MNLFNGSIYFSRVEILVPGMVRIFQPSSEIYVLGGPNISKCKDPWETNNFRGVHIYVNLPVKYMFRGGGGSKYFEIYKDQGEPFWGVQIFYNSPPTFFDWGGNPPPPPPPPPPQFFNCCTEKYNIISF